MRQHTIPSMKLSKERLKIAPASQTVTMRQARCQGRQFPNLHCEVENRRFLKRRQARGVSPRFRWSQESQLQPT